MDKLHYIDHKQDEVRTVESTRDRLLSTSPIFYTSKRTALVALKDVIEAKMQGCVCKIMEIEKQLAKNE